MSHAPVIAPSDVDAAVGALHEHGLVVLAGAADADALRALKERMDRDTVRLLEYCAQIGAAALQTGHLTQGPPPYPPFLHESVLAHPHVWAMAHRLLGPGAALLYYSGNTNCPGSGFQPVHIDQPHAYDGTTPMSTLVLSIPVQDISAHNGAMEVWPGTHTLATEPRVSEARLDERRTVRPPFQIEGAVGDIVIRDARMWHRGVTNPSDEYRHLISVVLHASPRTHVAFDHSARPFVESVDVNLNATYDDLREDYLFGPTRWLTEAQQGVATDQETTAKPLADI